MDNNFSSADLEFQQEVRAFFESAYTPDLQEKAESGKDHKGLAIEWQNKLNDQGWFAVDWPVEVGGTGWTPVQKFIFETERCNAGAPDVVPFGVKMVAPVIFTFGNDEQKKRFLPRILKSEDWWCQGYSEPGAADSEGTASPANPTRTTK